MYRSSNQWSSLIQLFGSEYNDTVKEIIVQEGTTRIMGLNNFRALEKITIPESVKIIDWNAFANCANLKHIDLPDNLNQICGQAFANSRIESIVIPEYCWISSDTFINCNNLKCIVLKNKDSYYYSDNAFNNLNCLEAIYSMCDGNYTKLFEGKFESINRITYYYSESKPNRIGNFWHYVNDVPTPWN